MKTYLLALPLFLAACASEPASEQDDAGLADGIWLAGERSGFCSAEDSAALIFFDDDGSNCMAEGRVETVDGGLAFLPRGDRECRIPISEDGDTLTFGDGGEACSYYCGGTATLAGQTVRRSSATNGRLDDIAGDPLC